MGTSSSRRRNGAGRMEPSTPSKAALAGAAARKRSSSRSGKVSYASATVEVPRSAGAGAGTGAGGMMSVSQAGAAAAFRGRRQIFPASSSGSGQSGRASSLLDLDSVDDSTGVLGLGPISSSAGLMAMDVQPVFNTISGNTSSSGNGPAGADDMSVDGHDDRVHPTGISQGDMLMRIKQQRSRAGGAQRPS